MSTKIEQLQRQNESLQNKAHLAELAEISRGLAHTIRNPLNTLNLAIDQMHTENKTAQQHRLSKLAKHQITRIDKWVRSLMDVMTNDDDLIRKIDLVQLIQTVISDLKLSNDKAIEFEFKPSEEKVSISAIEPELKSLLQSLISNAVEASPKNAKIVIAIKPVKDGYCLSIIDQGEGFSEEILAKLFTPHNTNKTYGAGMGLYLAERVIRHKYHGEIKVKNNTEIGSSVELIISGRGESI